MIRYSIRIPAGIKKGIVKRQDAMKTIFGASKKMVADICRMVPTNPGDIGSIFILIVSISIKIKR